MRIPRVPRKTKDGINSKFRPQDQREIDRANDHNPKIAVFLGGSEEDDRKLCATCGTELIYFQTTDKYWCHRCLESISAINNTPLTKTDQSMQPYRSQHDNPNNSDGEPTFISWSPDSVDQQKKDYEVTYSSSDGRVKKIRCKDGFPKDISIKAFED